MIIDSKAYVFNLGDSKAFVYREEKIYQMAIDHIPVIFYPCRAEPTRRKEFSRQVGLCSTTG